MSGVRILVSDKLSEAGLRILREASFAEIDYQPGLNEEQLAKVIGEYDGLVIRSGSKVTAKVLESATNLRVIGRAGIGVDNVDVPAASKRGIVVMNTPTGNSVTTAEHALSLLAALARQIPQASASTKAGKWEKNKFQGTEMAHKTLGIVGLGNIGRIVATRAQGWKMKIIGSDPVMTKERAAELGIELVDFPTLLERADFITIHAPLTPDTQDLFDDAAFAKVKPGLLIVNAARGGIINEDALVRAIDGKKIAGAALDVFVEEPVNPKHELLKREQVICTPHLGASTFEAQERVAIEIAEQVVDFLARGAVKNAVNVPALPPELAERLKPYLRLGEQLGSLLGQLEPTDVREVRVTCSGEAGELGVTPIARTALSGFLRHHLEEPVNPVSAPYEAEDRGIQLVEIKEPAGRYASSVRITISGDKGIHTATGTLGSKSEARLVGLEGYEIDAVLEGQIIVMTNQDRPGVIGAVGTLLGKKKINVSRMQVGLDESTGQALALYNVDHNVSEDALKELGAIENVSRVLYVSL